MSENSQDYAQKPQRNCTSVNSGSGYANRSANLDAVKTKTKVKKI
jgi:hypothetical protein